jgi:hypothetical protein
MIISSLNTVYLDIHFSREALNFAREAEKSDGIDVAV